MLMLHSGAQAASRADLDLIPVPNTRSHVPIPYGAAVDYLIEQVQKQFGLLPTKSEFGLQKEGVQMFARLQYDVGDEKSALSVGLRNSYDKTLKCLIGGGRTVFVCDNLSFKASGFVVMRKNTVHAWRDFQYLCRQQVAGLMKEFEASQKDEQVLTGVPCNKRRGFSLLGVALGEKLLTPTQATIAFDDWREPRHEEFADMNLWSLYNCVTEGLKKGTPSRIVERHANAHTFFMQAAALPAALPSRQIINV